MSSGGRLLPEWSLYLQESSPLPAIGSRQNSNIPQNGERMTWHEVWSGITATSFTQTGEMGKVGGPLNRAVAIHGTKRWIRTKLSSIPPGI